MNHSATKFLRLADGFLNAVAENLHPAVTIAAVDLHDTRYGIYVTINVHIAGKPFGYSECVEFPNTGEPGNAARIGKNCADAFNRKTGITDGG